MKTVKVTPGHEPKLRGHLEHLHVDFLALLAVIVDIFLITEYRLFSDWLKSFPFCKITILIVTKQPLDSVPHLSNTHQFVVFQGYPCSRNSH